MEWGPCFHGVPMSNLGTQSLVSFVRKNWVSESLGGGCRARHQHRRGTSGYDADEEAMATADLAPCPTSRRIRRI
uniref:Uncharacterized protein n=1 Tax=Oryza sativa subsp. japonica TaxID=39947 RepID=Q69RR2_ORYSJ|nr:hypothetical protein [Oryza sativa Japonica Group]